MKLVIFLGAISLDIIYVLKLGVLAWKITPAKHSVVENELLITWMFFFFFCYQRPHYKEMWIWSLWLISGLLSTWCLTSGSLLIYFLVRCFVCCHYFSHMCFCVAWICLYEPIIFASLIIMATDSICWLQKKIWMSI